MKITTDIFIERAKTVHGDKYDYSKSIYTGTHNKLCIICPKHGEFWQTAHNHIDGHGCPKCKSEECGNRKRKTKECFAFEARKVHGDKYDYSKVEYINNKTKVCIICPEHGEFWQTPDAHLRGNGCPLCYGSFKLGKDLFEEKARKIHDNKYDYSKVIYNNNKDKVCIICPEHGEFWQTPHNHLSGYGCPYCSHRIQTLEGFIEKCIEVHGELYDYSDVKYVDAHTKIKIICPEHGEFWQMPYSHIGGRGCPLCKTSHLERNIQKFLKEHNIDYVYQYRNYNALGKQSIDFFLKRNNIGIECQGEQHFIANFFKSKGVEHAEKHLQYIKHLDEEKRKKCFDCGIDLIYFMDDKFLKYMPNNLKDKSFSSYEKLLEYINSK